MLAFLSIFFAYLTMFFSNGCIRICYLKSTNEEQSLFIFFLPTLFQMIGNSSYMMFYIVLAYHLQIRFKLVNKILLKRFHLKESKNWTSDQNFRFVLNSHPPCFILKLFSRLLLQLNDVILSINKIFTVPISVFVAFNLFGLIFSLYETYDILKHDHTNFKHLLYNISMYVLQIFNFVYTFFIVKISMLVVEQRNFTCDILFELLCENSNDKLRRKISLFLAQVRHSKANFSSGMFNIDWSLLYTVRNFNTNFFFDFFHFVFAVLWRTCIVSCHIDSI